MRVLITQQLTVLQHHGRKQTNSQDSVCRQPAHHVFISVKQLDSVGRVAQSV
jgi:hypothetical protein